MRGRRTCAAPRTPSITPASCRSRRVSGSTSRPSASVRSRRPGARCCYDRGMKRTQLEKLEGKKISGAAGNARGGQNLALGRREQALARKRELLARRKPPPGEK